MRLRTRVALAIVVPLIAVVIATVAVTARVVAENVERGERERIEGTRRHLAGIWRTVRDALPRPGFLDTLAGALSVEIVAWVPERGTYASTLEGEAATRMEEEVRAGRLRARFRAAADGDSVRHLDLAGAEYLAIDGSEADAELYLLYPRERITGAVARARRPIVLIGLALLLGGAGLGFVLASRITRPIQRLAAEAGRLAGGDLEPDVAVRAPGEVGELADAFRAMVAGLRRSREELVRSERMATLGLLATSLAHEIRNPLSSMRMSVEVALEEPDEAERRVASALILEEIARLEHLVDDLLAFVRPGPPIREPVDVAEVARGTVQLLDRQMAHRKVDVSLDVGAELPAIAGDRRRLRQLLVNLMLNAAQAMPNGGRLGVHVEAGDGETVLAVTDEGGGIPESERERIFEPFVSLREGGTGLGLAVSRGIVDGHGGRIEVESGPGGTAFRVRLPARPV